MRENTYGKFVNAASMASVLVALVLSMAKYAACELSGSLTVRASLLDSLSDLCGSLINLCAVRYALRPANDKYKFGRGKAEALAGFAQSLFIMVSAGWIIYRIFFGQHPIENGTGGDGFVLWLMGGCSLLTLGLVFFQKYVIARTKSVAVMSDNLHYQGDLLSDLASITAIVAAKYFGVFWLDSIFGLVIAGVLFKGSLGILRSSFDILLDRELSPEIRREIIDIIATHDEVKEAHDLRTRSAGNQDFAQVHLSLNPDLSLYAAHLIGDEVENLLKNKFPNTQVLIHLDPFGAETNEASEFARVG